MSRKDIYNAARANLERLREMDGRKFAIARSAECINVITEGHLPFENLLAWFDYNRAQSAFEQIWLGCITQSGVWTAIIPADLFVMSMREYRDAHIHNVSVGDGIRERWQSRIVENDWHRMGEVGVINYLRRYGRGIHYPKVQKFAKQSEACLGWDNFFTRKWWERARFYHCQDAYWRGLAELTERNVLPISAFDVPAEPDPTPAPHLEAGYELGEEVIL